MERSAILALPKVELHTHIDCSLRYAQVRRLLPDITLSEFANRFIAPRACADLAEFLTCIAPSLSAMQTSQSLELAAFDLADQMAADGVVYGELRFAPLLHCNGGLRPEEVVEAVLSGLRKAPIEVGVILCTLRHFTTEMGLRTLDLVERYADQGVVGLDLAADERNFPIGPHVPVFAKAKALGINRTAHAGEAQGAESVIETIRLLNPSRIGHGVRSVEDPAAIDLLLQKDIHLEVCPSVNIQIGIFPSLEQHSLEQLRQAGVSLGINTDARTTTNVNLCAEYEAVASVFGWEASDFMCANQQALNASFAPEAVRRRVSEKLSHYMAKENGRC